MENPEPARVFANGAKLVGEVIVPGASLLLDGNVANGVVHAAVGLGANLLLGPIALVLVAADSYSKSVSNKYLWEHVTGVVRPSGGNVAHPNPDTARVQETPSEQHGAPLVSSPAA